MVKILFRILLPILWACAVYSCNVDLGGLFASTDLSERLKEKNNFEFLNRLPPLTLGDEYSFIVITDTHIEDGDAHGLENIQTLIVDNPQIKFAVFCGDLTQDGAEQDLRKFIEITGKLPIPAYPVIGNHDIYFGNFSVWKRLIGSTSYRVEGGGATLFILDSANSFLGKEQLDWLENELESADSRVFVFSHHNLFMDSPVNILQMSDTREIARTISLVRGKRGIMFTGHSHKRMVKELGGSLFISIEDFVTNQTYCLVSVTKTGVSYEFKKL
jgi:3',5'-cyclic AMP phosphodiesterase CpdA